MSAPRVAVGAEIAPMSRLAPEAVTERVFALIEAERSDGTFNLREMTSKVYQYLTENEPDLLREFSNLMVRRTLYSYYRRKLHHRRYAAKRTALLDEFNAAAEDVESRANWYEQHFSVNAQSDRKRVADMNGADHEYVAARYQKTGQRDLLLAAFHRRIARLVGVKRTEDVLTEGEYEVMFRTVVKGGGEEWSWDN